MKEPILSIIVPVFNGDKYLRATLESLVRINKKKDIEIIIQDALSTDKTSLIIGEYLNKFTRCDYYKEEDLGQSDAINRGVLKAHGKWVTWLCADDLLLDDFINMITVIENQDKFDVFYGDCIILEDNMLTPAIGTEEYEKGKLLNKRLFIQQPGTCILKNKWLEVNGLDIEMNWLMDYDLFVRLENIKCNFKRYNYFISTARIHKDAKTSSGSFLRFREYFSMFFRNHIINLQYFSFRPYTIYFVEFLIKKLEYKNIGFLKKFHSIFWKLAKPSENNEINKRFLINKKRIEDNISSLDKYLNLK